MSSFMAIVSQKHYYFDAPSDWSIEDLHKALGNRGFRPARHPDDEGRVLIGLVDAPEAKLVRPGEEIPYVSGVSGPQEYTPDGPSEFFPKGGTIQEVLDALKGAGLTHRLQPPDS